MPSFSYPESFIPSMNTDATNEALNIVNQGLSNANAPVPFNPVRKGLNLVDEYTHLVPPLVIRSGARGITRGGYLDRGGLGAENNYSWIKNEWLEKYSPKAWWRTATAHSFDNRNMGGPNFLFFKTGKDNKGELTKLGSKLQTRLQAASVDQPWIRKAGVLNESGELAHMWDPRMMARISASYDFAKMDSLSARNVQGLTNYLRASQTEGLAGGLEKFTKEFGAEAVSGKDAAMLTRLGVSGSYSGRLMGFNEGLISGSEDVYGRLGQMGIDKSALSEGSNVGLQFGQQVRNWATDESGEKLAYRDILSNNAISKAGAQAARVAGEDVAKTAGADVAKKLGARLLLTGAEVTGAVGEAGLNPVLDVLAIASLAQLVFDLAHVGVSAVAAETKAAFTSFRGDITRVPGNGFGFHDTVASATARQRGLQAIAASRLNARSILGNESSAMYSHFAGSEMGY